MRTLRQGRWAAIAKEAGVSNGSLFMYFDTKATLLNELYVALKAETCAAAVNGVPIEIHAMIREPDRAQTNGRIAFDDIWRMLAKFRLPRPKTDSSDCAGAHLTDTAHNPIPNQGLDHRRANLTDRVSAGWCCPLVPRNV